MKIITIARIDMSLRDILLLVAIIKSAKTNTEIAHITIDEAKNKFAVLADA